MIYPYYKISKTLEDKEFFLSHIGYFNFWGEYLILNLGISDCFAVIVNRPKRKFMGTWENNQKELFDDALSKSYRELKPEQMFEDFSELLR